MRTSAPPGDRDVEAERAAWRRIDEWDEAFRSLEVQLRQGLISTFTIEDRYFSVTVQGDGAGEWTCAGTAQAHKPSSQGPCAVMCPSQDDVRQMLQQNHAAFRVAGAVAPASQPPRDALPKGGAFTGTQLVATGEQGPATELVTRSLKRKASDSAEELRSLRRLGEPVITPQEQRKNLQQQNSSLFFDSAHRVHALLDVLRQHALAAPLAAAPAPAPQLPRLLAPAAFCNSTARSAEVSRTYSISPEVDGAAGMHFADLCGRFFPCQLRSLLNNLRVPLPSFECHMVADARYCEGINTFTQLGMRRIEAVKCERAASSASGAADWRWEFSLGA